MQGSQIDRSILETQSELNRFDKPIPLESEKHHDRLQKSINKLQNFVVALREFRDYINEGNVPATSAQTDVPPPDMTLVTVLQNAPESIYRLTEESEKLLSEIRSLLYGI